MSRCFPFPPPGYEKKAKNNDLDLLTKDKRKEKKHKKEKRDKEERKGKEKKDKERNKDRHREKKDRKEKHKDKKKSKDRNKDKTRTSDERQIEGQLEGCNGQKLGETSQRTEEIRNYKLVEELGKRIRDGGTKNQIVKNFISNGQIRTEGMRGMVEEGATKQTEEKKQIMDKKEEKKQIQDKKEEKQIKDKKGDRKADGSRNKNESQSMGNAVVPNFSGVIQKRVEELARLVEKDAEKKMEGNQKNKEKKGDDKRVDRHKDRDREKKSKSKDKDRDKEKKKKEKEKVKQKNDTNGFLHGESLKKEDKDRDKEKEKQKNDTNGFLNGESLKKEDKSLNVPTGSEKITPTEENLRKRKNSDSNGFLHDGEIRPNKLPRLLSSSHFLTGNGGKLDPQSVIQCAFNKQGAANNKTENKINGIIETQQFSSFSTKPSLATVKAKENGEVCTKPSHPDSKYLSKVLSIPKPEEYSDFDDQEWLFRSDDPRRKKPKAEFSGSDGPPQVWDKALRIESDDVCALPYVIPY